MEYKKKSFIVIFTCAMLLILTMLSFGIASSSKGTSAIGEESSCISGYEERYFNGNLSVGSSGDAQYSNYLSKSYCCPVDEDKTDYNEQYYVYYINGKLYCFNTKTVAKVDDEYQTTLYADYNITAGLDDGSDKGCLTYVTFDHELNYDDEEGLTELCKEKLGDKWFFEDYVSSTQMRCATSYKNCSVPAKNTVENTTTYSAAFYNYIGEQVGDSVTCDVSPGSSGCRVFKPIMNFSTGWGTTQGCTDGSTELNISEDSKFYACYHKEEEACFRNPLLNVHVWASYGEILDESYKNNNKIWAEVLENIETREECFSSNINTSNFKCEARNSTTGEVISGNISGCSNNHEEKCNYSVNLKGETQGNKCSVITPSSPSLDGYTFVGWGDFQCKGLVSGSASKEIKSDTINTFYPCYTKNEIIVTPVEKTYSVTFKDYDGRVLGSDVCTTTNGDTQCEVNALNNSPTRENHIFIGWSSYGTDCTTGEPWEQSLFISSNMDVYACYAKEDGSIDNDSTQQTFKATFNANGGTLNGGNYNSCLANSGSVCSINVPTASKTGSVFKGWNTSKTCTSGFVDVLTLNQELTTFYACYVVEGSSNVSDNPQTGQVAVFVILIIGIVAIVYSGWYFKRIIDDKI